MGVYSELSNKLSDEFKETYNAIPWKAIRGMRNVVAHEYGKIDEITIWETTESDTEDLRIFCLDILNNQKH